LPSLDKPDENALSSPSPAAIIPAGQSETVQELARREVENFKAMFEAERRLELQDERRHLLSRLAVIERKLKLQPCTCGSRSSKTK
jgi:hypothetical protein